MTLLVIEPNDIVRRAMDLRVTDRIENHGKDAHAESYTSGVVNTLAACIETIMEQANEAGLNVLLGPYPTLMYLAQEIARTDP